MADEWTDIHTQAVLACRSLINYIERSLGITRVICSGIDDWIKLFVYSNVKYEGLRRFDAVEPLPVDFCSLPEAFPPSSKRSPRKLLGTSNLQTGKNSVWSPVMHTQYIAMNQTPGIGLQWRTPTHHARFPTRWTHNHKITRDPIIYPYVPVTTSMVLAQSLLYMATLPNFLSRTALAVGLLRVMP